MKNRIAVWALPSASLALYLSSLTMPALVFRAESPVRGVTTLLWGWWGLFMFDFPWLANPAYFFALLLAFSEKRKGARLGCVLAIGFGLLSFSVRQWYFNEGGGTPIEKLGPAFYFWMASFVVLLVGVSWPIASRIQKRDTSSKAP